MRGLRGKCAARRTTPVCGPRPRLRPTDRLADRNPGHASPMITDEIHAERDLEQVLRVAKEAG